MRLREFSKSTFLLFKKLEFTPERFLRSFGRGKQFDDETDRVQSIPDKLENFDEHKRIVPLTVEEYKSLRCLKPCQPENPRLLKVTILGEPNVGKSTLTNRLVKWKVCAVSSKVHTTRHKAAAVLVHENKQIIFLDTPGFVTPEHSKKHHLEASFVMDPLTSVREADLVTVVVDISNKWSNNRINPDILEILNDFKNKKSILILNKIDAMKSKDRILNLVEILTQGVVGGMVVSDSKSKLRSKGLTMEEIFEKTNKCLENDSLSNASAEEMSTAEIENQRGWPLFSRVFMVSALKNDGVDDLRDFMLNEALPRDWVYPSTLVTDQHPHEIALTTIREKLMEYLPEEIPYKLDLRIKNWEILSTGCPKIEVKIVCQNTRHKRFVIGPSGRSITSCVENSRRAMREAFRRDVVLNLAVV